MSVLANIGMVATIKSPVMLVICLMSTYTIAEDAYRHSHHLN